MIASCAIEDYEFHREGLSQRRLRVGGHFAVMDRRLGIEARIIDVTAAARESKIV